MRNIVNFNGIRNVIVEFDESLNVDLKKSGETLEIVISSVAEEFDFIFDQDEDEAFEMEIDDVFSETDDVVIPDEMAEEEIPAEAENVEIPVETDGVEIPTETEDAEVPVEMGEKEIPTETEDVEIPTEAATEEPRKYSTRKPFKPTAEWKEYIITNYKQGDTLDEVLEGISGEYDISKETLKRFLRKNGIEVRDERKEPHARVQKLMESEKDAIDKYFSQNKDAEEIAEIMGLKVTQVKRYLKNTFNI